MADSKITALTALSAAPASDDFFVIVDVSDTTMSASGTNKKLAASYMLNAAGTVTGATSQAQTFTNGVVCNEQLSCTSATFPPFQAERTSTSLTNGILSGMRMLGTTTQNMTDGFGTQILLAIQDSANVINDIGGIRCSRDGSDSTGKTQLLAGAAAVALTILANGDTGIGTTSPTTKLDVNGTTTTTALAATTATVPTLYGSSATNGDITIEGTSSATKTSSYVILQPTGGNVGIGTASPGGLIDVTGSAGSVRVASTGNVVEFTRAAANYIACTQVAGTMAIVSNGLSPSIANSAIYIDASQQVGIGGQTPAAKLDVNGSIRSSYDTNTTSYFGRAAVGYNGTNSDYATFAHIDQNSGTNAALMQTSGGITILNCATDQYMALAINASIQYYMDASAFYPFTDDSKNLGQVSNRWDDVYATNGTIQTSDERKKKYIADSDLGLAFIERLRPVRYVWRQHKRRHYGLIAQEVKAAMDDLGIDDFAGYIHDEEADAYGLRYSEFVAPLIKAVQELRAEVNELREQVAG